MTEPTRLTYAQVAPIANAIHRRETFLRAGAGILSPPFAACPTCGQQPTELLAHTDHHSLFLEDRTAFGFRPCGHNFTADNEDLHRAFEAARAEVHE